MMTRNRQPSLWFWVALISLLTNKSLLELVLNLLEQGLKLVRVH